MTPALSERKLVGASRSSSLILLGGAVVLLIAAVIWFDRARNALPHAKQELARAEATLEDVRMRENLAQRNRVLLGSADTLLSRAQSLGVSQQHWGERQINLRQQHLKREEINQLLMSAVRGKGQLLLSDEFELSVTRADEGLFDTPESLVQPVMLSLRGTVYFRISER